MATIKLDKERPLLFSLQALKEINKKFGSLEQMQELAFSQDQEAQLDTVVWMITMMINQAILEHNMEVELGIIDGEKEKLLPEDYVRIKIKVQDLPRFKGIIYETISGNTEFESEDDDEGDVDLKEIQNEKNA